MIPAQFVEQLVCGLSGTNVPTRIQNADLAFHVSTTPAVRVPLLSRLVPAAVRHMLQERAGRRRHERDLIALWEMSPHLLKDIGVVLSADADLPDHLVAAPARVIDHVIAHDPAQVVKAMVEFPTKTRQPAQERPTIGRTLTGTLAQAVPSAA